MLARLPSIDPAYAELPTDSSVLSHVADIWIEVTKREDARFADLNTRGVSVVAVSGLITTIVGVFAKDLQSSETLVGWIRVTSAALLGLCLLTLVAGAATALVGVLRPRRQADFGANEMTLHPRLLRTPQEVNAIVVREFWTIAIELQKLNSRKAVALEWAYGLLVTAIVGGASAGLLFASDAVFY
jgi:hypothetical protein